MPRPTDADAGEEDANGKGSAAILKSRATPRSMKPCRRYAGMSGMLYSINVPNSTFACSARAMQSFAWSVRTTK